MIEEKENQIYRGVAIIIENSEGEFLLHLRDENAPHMKNQWCLLGGGIESGENEFQAAIREIEEEIGIKINSENLKFFKKIILADGKSESYIFHAILDLKTDQISIGEGKEFRFFNKNELLQLVKKLDYSNSFLKVLLDYINN